MSKSQPVNIRLEDSYSLFQIIYLHILSLSYLNSNESMETFEVYNQNKYGKRFYPGEN
jgi:hypothetical protein